MTKMQSIKLKTIALSNRAYVRPSYGLGTCGFYPKAWQVSPIKRGQSPIDAFLNANPNWKREEVSKCI